MEVIPLGVTSLPEEVFLEYLDSLKSIYSHEAYDLFQHNCNNFTNDVSQFLCGRSIPSHIVSLPQTVLNTPFGQMLKPQLEAAMRPITTAPTPHATYGARAPGQPRAPSKVIAPKSLKDLEKVLASAENSCAVVFFTSPTCGPCQVISPRFEELASDAGNKAKLIKLDIDIAYDAALRYEVSSTPTFMTFLKGEKVEEWVGASESDLKSRVDTLLRMAYPRKRSYSSSFGTSELTDLAHPHMDVKLPITLSTPVTPIAFAKVPPLAKVIEKLDDTGMNPIVASIRDFIATRESKGAVEAHLPHLSDVATFLGESYVGLPAEKLFPLVDLFRVMLSDARVSGWFAEEKGRSIFTIYHSSQLTTPTKGTATIKTMLSYPNTHPSTPYSLRLVTLQAACNLFTTPLFAAHLTTTSLSAPLAALVTSSLLDAAHAACRVAASSLVFNLATYTQKQRSVHGQEVLDGVTVDIVASVVEALKSETESKEVVRGLVLSLALLFYCSPMGGEVADLVKVLDAGAVVREKIKGGLGEKGLCEEVARLLES